MNFRSLSKILLAFLIIFASNTSFAKTIKWSMQGDSLTLDPHAQNEGQPLKYQDKFMKLLLQED